MAGLEMPLIRKNTRGKRRVSLHWHFEVLSVVPLSLIHVRLPWNSRSFQLLEPADIVTETLLRFRGKLAWDQTISLPPTHQIDSTPTGNTVHMLPCPSSHQQGSSSSESTGSSAQS